MTANLSPCCGADIIVAGHGMTHWYACEACGKEIPDQVQQDFEGGDAHALCRRPAAGHHAVTGAAHPTNAELCPTCWVECVTVDGVRACPACKQAVEA